MDVKTIQVSPLWGRGQPREAASSGKYIYASTVLKYNLEVLVLYLSSSIYAALYFLLNYIYMTAVVTAYFADS